MKTEKKNINIGTHPSGVKLEIVYYEISNGEGPTLYIQGGIHGGEITYWIIKNIYDYLIEQEIKGKIILVPIANPIAWFQRTYYNTFGKFDLYMGKDWNRNFPGKIEGTLGERTAFHLFGLSRNANYIVDLHTSRKSFPFVMISDQQDIQIAKKLGIEYVYVEKEDYLSGKYKGTFSDHMRHIGIPSITIECGSHDDYNKQHIDQITDGIISLMKSLGIVPQANIKSNGSTIKLYSDLTSYNAKIGGFCIYHKNVGDEYKKGDLLYEISNPEDIGSTEKVFAREDGIVQKISPTHIMRPGDQVIESICKSDLSEERG